MRRASVQSNSSSQVRYFWRQAHWLTERFPKAKLCDVDGLVKLVDRAEIEANDWSLTPGRYVGVAPEEEDGDFDFKEALREIHVELETLNTEAVSLAATIKRNFEELGDERRATVHHHTGDSDLHRADRRCNWTEEVRLALRRICACEESTFSRAIHASLRHRRQHAE